MRTFLAEAFFFLHIINQYETQDGNYIVLDICCYRDAKMLDCMYIDRMQVIFNALFYIYFNTKIIYKTNICVSFLEYA
jgi:hypothetical protein